MKWIIATVLLAVTIRTSGQQTTTYTTDSGPDSGHSTAPNDPKQTSGFVAWRVALDKSEGVVKAQNSLAVVFHRFASQSGGEPKP